MNKKSIQTNAWHSRALLKADTIANKGEAFAANEDSFFRYLQFLNRKAVARFSQSRVFVKGL
jgi:hypothetical protein